MAEEKKVKYHGILNAIEKERFYNEFVYMAILHRVNLKITFIKQNTFDVTLTAPEALREKIEKLMTQTSHPYTWLWSEKMTKVS